MSKIKNSAAPKLQNSNTKSFRTWSQQNKKFIENKIIEIAGRGHGS